MTKLTLSILTLSIAACSAQTADDDGTDVLDLKSPQTYTSRHDRTPENLPAQIPSMGNEVGQGTIITDPAFANRIVRATDSTTAGRSLQTADSGEPNLWNVDSTHFVTRIDGGTTHIVAFDPKTMKPSNTPLTFNYDLEFSHHDPRVLFGLDGTKLVKIVLSQDYTTSTEEVLFDYVNGATGEWGTTSNCLAAGFDVTWNGAFIMPKDDSTFVVSFSDAGAQGTGYYVAAFRSGKGCRVLNTRTGTITGTWGPTGTITDGSGAPLADRFTLHSGASSPNSRFALMSQNGANCTNNPDHCHDKKGDPIGCLAGNCETDTPYVWEIATRKLRSCGLYGCDGHAAHGFLGMAVGKRFALHDYADPSGPLTKLVDPPAGFPDMHGSWHNTDINDSVPLFAVSADVPSAQDYPCEWYDEVIAIVPDGSGTVYRFAHTFNTGTSPYFIVQNAIGVVSQDGRFLAFASDWMNTLGTDAENNPRGDVFVVELK